MCAFGMLEPICWNAAALRMEGDTQIRAQTLQHTPEPLHSKPKRETIAKLYLSKRVAERLALLFCRPCRFREMLCADIPDVRIEVANIQIPTPHNLPRHAAQASGEGKGSCDDEGNLAQSSFVTCDTLLFLPPPTPVTHTAYNASRATDRFA